MLLIQYWPERIYYDKKVEYEINVTNVYKMFTISSYL